MKSLTSLHFTSLHFALLFCMSLMLISCEWDDTSNPDASLSQSPAFSLSDETLLSENEGKCNCEYRVISYSGNGPAPGNHLEFYLLGGEPQTCDLNCRYFQGLHGACSMPFFDPLCDDEWTAFPTSYYNFNCQPFQNSSFIIEFQPQWFPQDCIDPTDPLSASITFEIRCSRVNPRTACLTSEPFSATKTISWPETKATVQISREQFNQCGCMPSFAISE